MFGPKILFLEKVFREIRSIYTHKIISFGKLIHEFLFFILARIEYMIQNDVIHRQIW